VLDFSFDYSVIESSIFGDIVQKNKQKSNLLSSLLPRYPYKMQLKLGKNGNDN